MDNIKNSIREPSEEGQPKTIVIDSIQLRDEEPTKDRPLLDREPILKTSTLITQSGSSSKTELQIGDGENNPTGIVAAYLKNNIVEISDDQITIKDGTDSGSPLFKIKVDTHTINGSTHYDLNINDAFVLGSSGKVKKILIDD